MSSTTARGSTGLSADDVRIGARFLADLPRFLRTPFSLEQAPRQGWPPAGSLVHSRRAHDARPVLPVRFGGQPTDYQLVERLDGAQARPEVTLLVDPGLGPLDEEAVLETFLTAIGGGSGGERLMELQWRRGGVLRIARRPPRRTASGKILHLHSDRPSEAQRRPI